MIICGGCGGAMIRADLYDPEGTTPSRPMEKSGHLWVCISCTRQAIMNAPGLVLEDDPFHRALALSEH